MIENMIINIFIFIIVLLCLVMIHELGHFLAAKISKMRVEEFAFGFPPKLFGKKVGETYYAFNALPIGGYVKITGESFDESERERLKSDKRAFQNRPRMLQLFVLISGVAMNLILACVLFFCINIQPHLLDSSNTEYAKYITDPKMYVSSVIKGSPAESAGLKAGSQILGVYASLQAGSDIGRKDKASLTSTKSVIDFVKSHSEQDISIVYKNIIKDTKTNQNKIVISTSTVSAVYGLVPEKKSVGMSLVYGEYLQLSLIESLRLAAYDTYNYTRLTAVGLGDVFMRLMRGEGVMDSLSGPVGMASMVGKASSAGLENLIFMVAILSINLAVFNLLPVPALDGGRILFVIYEAMTRRSINYRLQYYANTIGFLLLIGLMIFTTYFDIIKLFH